METKEYLTNLIAKLSQPLPYKWKVQSFTKDKSKAICVAYIDARDVISRLNEVCEYGWHRDHFALGNDVYCRLGVTMPDGTIIWRSDAGDSDNETERAKTAASDSFKRAAVQFGVGLFLYDLDIVTLPAKANGNYTDVVDSTGKKIWDLTAHINGMKNTPPSPKKPKNEKKEEPKKEELTPSHKNWAYTVKRVADGVEIKQIEAVFRISEENKKKLQDEAKQPVPTT